MGVTAGITVGWRAGVAGGDSVFVGLYGSGIGVAVGKDNVRVEGAVEVGGLVVVIAVGPQANIAKTKATLAITQQDPSAGLIRHN